ncbi:hypothetical protein PVAP13_7KG035209 [Panicum virgatum]|uniref:Uncharacterized protein n=1 Tax=Panicum virgatum TaxID=38727 RepID=A0A8T0QDG2_PANVG|nr:hypothetical protein PVAP13_7KG035209 [Panicum virgatum]
MLQFQPKSKVHRLDSRGDKIPHYAFKFCPFDQLSSKDITSKPLLGVISHIGPYDFASATSSTKLRKVKIRGQEEQTQEIQLWGEHGETFNEAEFLEKSKQGIIVAIFARLTARSFKAKVLAKARADQQQAVGGSPASPWRRKGRGLAWAPAYLYSKYPRTPASAAWKGGY